MENGQQAGGQRYNLSGRPTTKQRGVVIEKQGGKTRKVLKRP